MFIEKDLNLIYVRFVQTKAAVCTDTDRLKASSIIYISISKVYNINDWRVCMFESADYKIQIY